MSWRGKLLGGSLGSFLGPWGAVAGAAAGHYLIDRKARETRQDHSRLLVLSAAALSQLARVDSVCNEHEVRVMVQVLSEANRNLGNVVEPHRIGGLIKDSQRVNAACQLLARETAPHVNLAYASLTWFWRVAVSDAELVPSEYDFVQQYARLLPLPPEAFDSSALLYLRTSTNTPAFSQAYAVLGLAQQADQATLKSTYRRLSQTYHPDKHANLEPAIQALAAEKFAQIKDAYELLSNRDSLELFARHGATRRLSAASAGMPVLCFHCNMRQQLPEQLLITRARCHQCQSLLAFERQLAQELCNV